MNYDEITPGMDLGAFARKHGVRFVRKDQWWLTRIIARLLFWIDFQGGYWTTIGRTVAYPVDGPEALDPPHVLLVPKGAPMDAETFGEFKRQIKMMRRSAPVPIIPAGTEMEPVSDPEFTHAYLELHRQTVEHEYHHVLQYERWGVLWGLAYLLLPLPVGLAWWRWTWEREPYLYQIRHYGRDVERSVDVLWSAYLCWPKPWMRRWFRRELGQ